VLPLSLYTEEVGNTLMVLNEYDNMATGEEMLIPSDSFEKDIAGDIYTFKNGLYHIGSEIKIIDQSNSLKHLDY
jgi:hypothetical protein